MGLIFVQFRRSKLHFGPWASIFERCPEAIHVPIGPIVRERRTTTMDSFLCVLPEHTGFWLPVLEALQQREAGVEGHVAVGRLGPRPGVLQGRRGVVAPHRRG